jgi:hypothetical protein
MCFQSKGIANLDRIVRSEINKVSVSLVSEQLGNEFVLSGLAEPPYVLKVVAGNGTVVGKMP